MFDAFYQDQLRETPIAEAFAGNKNSLPLIIGEEFDKYVREYMQSTEATVNAVVVIALN